MIVTVFDSETTGKLTPDHRIIEASFRVCDFDNETELEEFLLRFNPERNIEAKAMAVHGITNEELKHEKTFCEQKETILEILKRTDLLVYHNGDDFDLPFLKQEFERCGITELPEFKTFDTMVNGTWATDLGKSPTLFELCWSLDIVFDPTRAHRGNYDTEVLRDAFFNGVRLGWFKI